MRLLAGLLFASTFAVGCHSQTADTGVISANFIIPLPPPTAPIAQWVAAEGRTAFSLEADGATLRGFRYAGADPKAPVMLFFNGNGMTVLRTDLLYRKLAAMGPTVVAYDYRGYGFSTGKPDLMNYRNDALRLYDALAVSAPGHRVVVYGFSMGTVMASYIASERAVAALILGAPIASAAEEFPVYGKLIGYSDAFIATHKVSPDADVAFGEAVLVTKSHAPLLVLHGTEDNLIPANQSREVLAASPSTSKRMVVLPGADHNATASEPASFLAVERLLHELKQP